MHVSHFKIAAYIGIEGALQQLEMLPHKLFQQRTHEREGCLLLQMHFDALLQTCDLALLAGSSHFWPCSAFLLLLVCLQTIGQHRSAEKVHSLQHCVSFKSLDVEFPLVWEMQPKK